MKNEVSVKLATDAVNDLLDGLLPGTTKLNEKSRTNKHKTNSAHSQAQLIDRNLKESVSIQAQNRVKLAKKRKHDRKREIMRQKIHQNQWEVLAREHIMKKHQEKGTLDSAEKKLLQEKILHNTRTLKSRGIPEEMNDELVEAQNDVLHALHPPEKSLERRRRKKEFRETKNNPVSSNSNFDKRFPGLTPGLAPVDMSDEEGSSEED